MQSLRIKKFFLDYVIGTVLIFLLFYLLIGHMTVMDTRVTFELNHECSLPFSPGDVLDEILLSLHEGESCVFDSPCIGTQVLHCQGSVQVSNLYRALYTADFLMFRVRESPVMNYGYLGYKDSSTFRIPLSLILLFIGYGIVLTEAGGTDICTVATETIETNIHPASGCKKRSNYKTGNFCGPDCPRSGADELSGFCLV